MKAIVLAAGKGSRIAGQINDMPKSLLEINGKTILSTTVEMLQKRQIEVAICVGYEHQKIEQSMKSYHNISFYYNPFYELTNNIGTLWFAREEFAQEDVLILSADVLFSEDILDCLCNIQGDLVMATDSSRIQDGDYFFHLDELGEIDEYGPHIPLERRSCEYIGLSKIAAGHCHMFREQLEKMIEQGQNQLYFENVFFTFIGDRNVKLTTIDVNGKLWREIDFYADYQKALEQF